jgi:hypothetical protein
LLRLQQTYQLSPLFVLFLPVLVVCIAVAIVLASAALLVIIICQLLFSRTTQVLLFPSHGFSN